MKRKPWCSLYPAMPVRDGRLWTTIIPSSLYVPQQTHILCICAAVISPCRWSETHETSCHLSQDALSLLAEKAELSEEDGRGVAFRRAAAVLKCLPQPVTNMMQLRGLPCLGEHSFRVIKASTSVQLSTPTLSLSKMI